MPQFQVVSQYAPAGDQPQAIAGLAMGVENGLEEQTLLGVTGSGKTFTMAKVIEAVQRPTLVLAHNHVSGIATPSAEDIMTTRHLMDTLRSVGIGLWDHLIVVDGDMVSMRESGYLEGR